MAVAEVDEANDIDLEDVATDGADRAKSVDGVVPKQIFKSERDIPEVAAPLDTAPVQSTEGNLYGRQAAPGAGYYDENNDFHPGKEPGVAGSNGQSQQSFGENGEGDGGDVDEDGNPRYAYQGDDVGGGSGGGGAQGQLQEREGFAYDGGAGQGSGQPQESRTASAAKNLAEQALEGDAREALAVETAGVSELALWIKAHPKAAVAIICTALFLLLLAIVLIVVLLGEFACNGTVSSVTSWIYGHIGGTDYCSMLPKIK